MNKNQELIKYQSQTSKPDKIYSFGPSQDVDLDDEESEDDDDEIINIDNFEQMGYSNGSGYSNVFKRVIRRIS